MAVAPAPIPVGTGAVDPATGRLLPRSDDERRARSQVLGRTLDEVAALTDATDTDEVWRGIMRGIDEARPHRPLFEGSH